MYSDQHFYHGICNALSALVLSGVGNVQEAKCELRQFCIRVHRYIYGDLCGSCEITKNLIEEMENGYPYMHIYFCRCGGIDSYFMDGIKIDLEIDLDFGGKWTTKKERVSCLLIWVQRLKNCSVA